MEEEELSSLFQKGLSLSSSLEEDPFSYYIEKEDYITAEHYVNTRWKHLLLNIFLHPKSVDLSQYNWQDTEQALIWSFIHNKKEIFQSYYLYRESFQDFQPLENVIYNHATHLHIPILDILNDGNFFRWSDKKNPLPLNKAIEKNDMDVLNFWINIGFDNWEDVIIDPLIIGNHLASIDFIIQHLFSTSRYIFSQRIITQSIIRLNINILRYVIEKYHVHIEPHSIDLVATALEDYGNIDLYHYYQNYHRVDLLPSDREIINRAAEIIGYLLSIFEWKDVNMEDHPLITYTSINIAQNFEDYSLLILLINYGFPLFQPLLDDPFRMELNLNPEEINYIYTLLRMRLEKYHNFIQRYIKD